MPGKPTNDEVKERTEFVLDKMLDGKRTSEIKAEFRDKFGYVTGRCVEEYRSRARKVLTEMAGSTKDDLRAEALGRYSKWLSEAKSIFDKCKVQEGINKLFGLESPVRTELSGVNGSPIAVADATPKKPIDYDGMERRLRGVAGVPSSNGNGQSVHPAHTNGNPGNGSGHH